MNLFADPPRFHRIQELSVLAKPMTFTSRYIIYSSATPQSNAEAHKPRLSPSVQRNCGLCNGKCFFLGRVSFDKCTFCKGMGGMGTFGPCETGDVHFKSSCQPCGGVGYKQGASYPGGAAIGIQMGYGAPMPQPQPQIQVQQHHHHSSPHTAHVVVGGAPSMGINLGMPSMGMSSGPNGASIHMGGIGMNISAGPHGMSMGMGPAVPTGVSIGFSQPQPQPQPQQMQMGYGQPAAMGFQQQPQQGGNYPQQSSNYPAQMNYPQQSNYPQQGFPPGGY
jgi:hypothetical protein